MYIPQETSSRIKSLAEAKGITISKLQKEVGLGANAIYQSSKSEIGMGAKNLYAIAEVLECSVDYLLGRTDEPNLIVPSTVNSCVQNVNADGVGNLTQNNNSSNGEIDAALKSLTPQERHRAIADILDLLEEKYK